MTAYKQLVVAERCARAGCSDTPGDTNLCDPHQLEQNERSAASMRKLRSERRAAAHGATAPRC